MIKPENKRVNITVTSEEWKQIQQLSDKESLSVSKLVAQLINGAADQKLEASAQ